MSESRLLIKLFIWLYKTPPICTWLDLTVNYDNCCQAYSKASGRYNFANLGNLKNRSHKTMILKMEKDAKGTIVLRYSYIPVVEDKFLNSDSSYTPEEARDAVEGEVVLYIGR